MKTMKFILGISLAALIGAPAIALADAGTSSASTGLFSAQTVGVILTGIVGLAGILGGASWLTERRKRRIALAAYHAFHIVEDIAAEGTEENGFNKAARGLQVIDTWMVANGWRPLKPGEQAVAQLAFKTLHGEQKVSERMQESSVAAALGAIGTTAAVQPALEQVAAGPQMPRGER
ncbi:hypothetical protein DRW03_21220 [Corallococcus sp. H22C18031201]|nr:hypothetical protein DRW03_21220 [Corallococcus sp. H22C18031201]